MYRVIGESATHLYPRTMDEHFRLRRKVFVEEQGWSAYDVDGVYEKDNYDTPDAVYAMAIGPNEDVIGGFRLFPTTLPHMISEAFAHLVDGAPVSRPDVMEITRFHLAPEHRSSKTNFLEAYAAIQEVGLELGLSGITGTTRTMRLHMFQLAGMVAEPLGMPANIDGESTTAILIHVKEESLAAINKARNSAKSVLEHNQIRRRRAAA